MDNENEQLRRQFRRVTRSETYPIVIGDANGVVWDNPVLRPGDVRFRFMTSDGLSSGLPPVAPMGAGAGQMRPGASARLGFDYDGSPIIIAPNIAAQRQQGFNVSLNNAAATPPASQFVNTDQFLPFVSHPTTPVSLSIAIRSLLTIHNRQVSLFNGAADDLTSLIPAAGNQCLAAYFLKTDGTIETVASTVQSIVLPLDLTDIQELVDASSVGSIPGQMWWLHDGQTTIVDSDAMLDARQYVNIPTDGDDVRLATVSGVDMNTATPTALYTVRSGTSCVVTRVIVRAASTSLTTASYSFGFNSAAFNDVIADATHTELTGASLYALLNAKVGAKLGAAGDVFSVVMNTLQGGAATTAMDVFGYLI